MKLFLTSTGLHPEHPNIRHAFVGALKKPMYEHRVAFIPTAARTPEERDFTKISHDELVELGIRPEMIEVVNLDNTSVTPEFLSRFDIIYVCGGNTFYLLDAVNKSGFRNAIKLFDGLYIGVSAGTLITGPSIEIAREFDPNDIGLTDPTGLGLTPFALAVHYVPKDDELLAEICKNAPYEIRKLTDSEALYICDKTEKLITN